MTSEDSDPDPSYARRALLRLAAIVLASGCAFLLAAGGARAVSAMAWPRMAWPWAWLFVIPWGIVCGSFGAWLAARLTMPIQALALILPRSPSSRTPWYELVITGVVATTTVVTLFLLLRYLIH